MTGTQPMTYGRILTGLIISWLAALSFSAPLRKRESDELRPLHLDDMGAYTTLVLNGINFEQTNLSLEVRQLA